MSNEIAPKQELRDRLKENPLQDSDDLMAFVQYASRLAALGDVEPIEKLPEIFKRPPFVGKIADILKARTEQGIWEAEEYSGEWLALALINAQDFYCFCQKFPEILKSQVKIPLGCTADLGHFFDDWWDACEAAELDEDATEMLREFLAAFPIPEEERLPVINTPIAKWQYDLLEYLYKDIKRPIIQIHWSSGYITDEVLPSSPREVAYDMNIRQCHLLACDDGTPSDELKNDVESSAKHGIPQLGTLMISRCLDDAWNLQIIVSASDNTPLPIERIRIGAAPVIQDDEDTTLWLLNLKYFAASQRSKLLWEEPVVIQLTNGVIVQCGPNFSTPIF